MPDDASAKTLRYQETYERILNAAAALINSDGARGMTFAAVAESVGLNTTSVTYYFKRKEQLALSCYHRTMDRYEAFVDQAAQQDTPESRIAAFLAAVFDDLRAVREGHSPAHAVLLELRTLEEPAKTEALDRYRGIFGKLRALIGTSDAPLAHARLTGKANILSENLFWLPFWIDRYDLEDFPRVQARMTDLLLYGVAGTGQDWITCISDTHEPASSTHKGIAQDDFLRAATFLINERGYRGASVERIAAHLNVTKGSFYHHLDAKDDLVEACFQRSFAVVAQSQFTASDQSGSAWLRICGSIGDLLERQFREDAALLRSTALQALPPTVRATVVDQSNRLARRYSGMLTDGMADGSIRAIDPLIASQMLMALVNSAYDLRWWSKRLPMKEAVRFYGTTIAFGLLHTD